MVSKQPASEWVGKGVYSTASAGRLLGLNSARIAKWIAGYSTRHGRDARVDYAPIFARDFPDLAGRKALSFLDLIEVAFVNEFLKAGLSMQFVRERAAKLSIELQTPHPFSWAKLMTDGRSLFGYVAPPLPSLAVGEVRAPRGLYLPRTATTASRGVRVVEVHTGQTQIREIVEPLFLQLEHDMSTNLATRWWPRGRGTPVVIDPMRSFGAPVLARCNITTETLKAAHDAGESDQHIARWFGVAESDVRAAVMFEEELDQRRAA